MQKVKTFRTLDILDSVVSKVANKVVVVEKMAIELVGKIKSSERSAPRGSFVLLWEAR